MYMQVASIGKSSGRDAFFRVGFMRAWAGVNTQTGAPEWYVNGVDGEKRLSDYNKAQRVFQGTAIPKYNGGFGTNLSYKTYL